MTEIYNMPEARPLYSLEWKDPKMAQLYHGYREKAVEEDRLDQFNQQTVADLVSEFGIDGTDNEYIRFLPITIH